MNVLLQGIVGSTAYGLATPESDIDRLGVFAAPTQWWFTLRTPQETHVTTNPDMTMHEAKKFCLLALANNPTAMELLWLPDDLYEVRTPFGDQLIELRSKFLVAKRVRDAYLGYARSQLSRIRRIVAGFEEMPEAQKPQQMAKHARHIARLLHQGTTLYLTGHLPIRLPNPEAVRNIGQQAADGNIDPLARMFDNAALRFDINSPVLPDEADTAVVEWWLGNVRMHYLGQEDSSADR